PSSRRRPRTRPPPARGPRRREPRWFPAESRTLSGGRGSRETPSDRPDSGLDEAHDAIEGEADGANRDDGQQDVRVDETVVLLPQEAADARRAGQHFRGHDHEPGQPEREPDAGEPV